MAKSWLDGGPGTEFAEPSDLPYAMVELGEWAFSDGETRTVTLVESEDAGSASWYYMAGDQASFETYSTLSEAQNANTFTIMSITYQTVTATRTGVHLLDRAGNAVAVGTATTLTLPALVNAGKARDLYVRLAVSASGAGSAVTWTVAQGESWDAAGAPPSSLAEGMHLYRITEVAPGVFHCEDMLALVGLEAALAAINGESAP